MNNCYVYCFVILVALQPLFIVILQKVAGHLWNIYLSSTKEKNTCLELHERWAYKDFETFR